MKKFVFVSVFVLFGCLNAFCVGIEVGASFDISNYRYTVTAIIDGTHTQTEVSIAAVPGKKAEITEINIPFQVTWTHTELGVSVETPCIVTSVAETGFQACTKVQSITIPGSVKKIGMAAFRDITNPFTVTFNEGLEVIGNRAFCKSTGLQNTLVFPKSLKTIEEQAFGGCNSVSYIEFLSTSPVDIQSSNFGIDASTTNGLIVAVMYVPEGTGSDWRETYSKRNYLYPFANKETETVVGDYLYDIYDIYDQPTEDGARVSAVWKKQCPANVVFEDKVTIGGKTRFVTDVKASCFNRGRSFWANIKTITFPSTMQRIGKEAFRSIDSTFTIELNEGLKVIGDRAFCRSTGLRGTTSRNDIGQSALVIPSTVDTIRSHAFYDCTSITDSVIMQRATPPTVPAGEGFLFGNVPAVVRIPCRSVSKYKAENINYWSTRTLYDPCDDDIVLGPNFMYRIIDKEKRYLSLLGRRIVCDAAVIVPDSLIPEGKDIVDGYYYVKKIAAKAFNSNNLLTSVTIPAGVDTIESDAFLQNKSLQEVKVAAKVIGSSAFNECSALQEVILEEGVETIKDRAFIRCYALTEVSFPKSIQHIEDYAFYLDTLITDITFLGETAPTLGGPNILGAQKSLKNIWVPCGAYWNYYDTGVKDRWDALRDDLRSSCPALELGEDENITEDMTVSTIALRRQFNLDEWTPLYFPFEIDSVLVVNCNNNQRININRPWTIENGGYFYLETLKDIDTKSSTLSFELADAIQPQTPYLIQFPNKGNDYFADKDIIFKSKEGEYTLQASKQGNLTCTTEYTIKGNEGYVNEDVSTGYFLNYNQNNNIYHLYLKENSSLSPFGFVLLPPQEVSGTPSKAPRRFSMRTSSMGNISGGDITTSLTTVSDTEPIRYTRDGEQVTLYPAGKALKVYSIDGMLLYSVEAGTDIVTMNLSAGMYILYCNGNSQKMLL